MNDLTKNLQNTLFCVRNCSSRTEIERFPGIHGHFNLKIIRNHHKNCIYYSDKQK